MVDLAGLEVDGISIGGVETCIEVPEYKLAFDVGRCPRSAVARKTILFTHAHADHMGGIVHHAATRCLQTMSPATYVVPREDVEAFGAMVAAWRRLDRSELPHELVPLGPGGEHRLRKDLVARPFRSPHTAPCQGYVIWSTRQKLLPEYQGMPSLEIARLRREGVEVTETLEVPELAVTGDTRIEVLEREESVRRARRLVMEVTFLDDRVDVDRARETGHVHLDQVIERAQSLENEAILFTHFSARYSREQIVGILDERLPSGLRKRVTPLLTGFE